MEHVEFALTSGARLYVFPMAHAKRIAFSVLVNLGSRDEVWPKEAGIAHALEHLLFLGTEDFPDSEALDTYIESAGGRLNAMTMKEMTIFSGIVMADHAERAFHALSQMIRKPLLPEHKIRAEMDVIVGEIRECLDTPENLVMIELEKALYGSHPLGRPILGLPESILAFEKDDFRRFMWKGYWETNRTYVVAGNIEPTRARDLVEHYFPEKTIMPPLVRQSQAIKDPAPFVCIEKPAALTYLGMAASTGPVQDRTTTCLALFEAMIGGGSSFPLFQEIRAQRGICYRIDSALLRQSDVGEFVIYINAHPHRADEAIALVHEVIAQSKSNAKLLERAKTVRKVHLATRYESPAQTVIGAAKSVAFYGTLKTYEEIAAEIDSVTREEIDAAVDRYLRPEQFTVAKIIPAKSRP